MSPITCSIDFVWDFGELHTTVSAETVEALEEKVKERIKKLFRKNV